MKCYDDYSSDNALLRASALAGVAACFEAKNEYAKAAPQFEKAAAILSTNANTPEYMSAAARCYGMGGDKAKAVSILKQLKKEYPTSTSARDADRYISQFSV